MSLSALAVTFPSGSEEPGAFQLLVYITSDLGCLQLGQPKSTDVWESLYLVLSIPLLI